MSFEWEHYLDLAQRLAQADDEASQRSAISRAYYAAFHLARKYVEKAHPEVSLRQHGVEHGAIWAHLKSGNSREPVIGEQGDRLRQTRVKADYRLVGLRFPQDTRFALDQARLIIRTLKSMVPPP